MTQEERADGARKAGAIRWQRVRGDRQSRTCEGCEMPFNVRPSDTGRRFCTLKCRREFEGKTRQPYKSSREVIYEHSIPEPNSGCWLWIGKSDSNGYGKVNRRGMYHGSAHKLAFMAFDPEEREIAEMLASLIGFDLDHKWCNLPCCVNWQHLEPVTHAENLRRRRSRRLSPRSGISEPALDR